MSLRAAILGFLAIEPSSGYTLKQRFEGSTGSFWTATQSQIYRELHAIAATGLAKVSTVPSDGKPDRKVYALTAAGRRALADWLKAPLDPLVLRHPLLLKFVFAADLAPADLDRVLSAYADGIAATRADYLARIEAPEILSLARSEREALIWRLSLDHGLAWCDMEEQWIARARKALAVKEDGRWTRKAK